MLYTKEQESSYQKYLSGEDDSDELDQLLQRDKDGVFTKEDKARFNKDIDDYLKNKYGRDTKTVISDLKKSLEKIEKEKNLPDRLEDLDNKEDVLEPPEKPNENSKLKLASILYGPQGAGQYVVDPEIQNKINLATETIVKDTVLNTSPEEILNGKFNNLCWNLIKQHSKINQMNPGNAPQAEPLKGQ